jgi:P4 family phage/plasmid primase-like protien
LNNIFASRAPLYWAAGISAIPLRQRNKMPDINAWNVYGSRLPDAVEQDYWLTSFPNGNIGVALGPASGLCIIDIDTEDEDLIAAIVEICGHSPWMRVGKKGMALAYKFESQKNFKLRSANGGMLCEFLGLGNQCVMPGSIHPETGRPYTSNTNLWEVKDELPSLGADIEVKLRTLLGAKGFEIGAGSRSAPLDIVPAGERDVQMIRHAGYLARVVLGIDRSASFSLHEAIMHMQTWVEDFTAKVSGDAMDPNKGVAKLFEFLIKDLEAGRSMPDDWDSGLPEGWQNHQMFARIQELNAGQRWTFAKARSWFDDQLLEKPECDDWVASAVQKILQIVAKDDRFPEAHANPLYAHIVRRCGGLGYSKRDLARMHTNARKGLEEGENDNHALIGRVVLEEMQRLGEIRFDHGQFWQWNGSCFAPLHEDMIYLHVAENVKDSALVRRNSDYKAIVEVLEKMCKGVLVQVKKRGINFANGFVDEDLIVNDHSPKYGATFTLPFEYDRGNAMNCNRWFEFLRSCWGLEEDFEQRVLALQEMFAATLFGIAPAYQRAFLLFGRAGTGKTQVLSVLRAMLPPNAVADLGPQHWGERFSLTDLIGKTANICGEMPENGIILGNTFKEVVEGSPIRSEFKGQDGFVFVPKCAHWFASNYLPVSRDTSRGFIRRWLILDFNNPVKDEDKIENLAELIVSEEREALTAWALEGLRRVLNQKGYTLPACHDRRISQMRRINNSVQAFLEDAANVRLDSAGEMKCRDLYDMYGVHMRDVGRNQPVSFERFLQMLEDLDLDLDHRVDPIGTAEYWANGVTKAVRLAA